MASNKELKLEADELSENLGIPLDLKGMNNEALADLVSDLKAKIRDRDNVTQADEAQAAAASPPAAPAAASPPAAHAYCIAAGKALTTMRGILSEGQELSARDVIGGQDTIDMRVKSGHIVKG